MDTDRFDNLLRSLSETPSRRGALRALGGFGLAGLLGNADADAKRKKKKKKKKTPPQTPPPPPPPPPPPCQGQADGTVCGAGRICAQGQCVTGQGTCLTGSDACRGSAPCGGANANCFCFTTMANQTRCGYNSPLGAANSCGSDANCAAIFPFIPGVFCFKDTGDNCGVGGQCMAPCPS